MILFPARARSPQEAEQCAAMGFEMMEITLPCPDGEGEENIWFDLKKRLSIELIAHGPQEGDPSDLAHLETGYLPRLRSALEAAARLGCPWLTIHFWLESRWLSQSVIQGKIDLLRRVADWGAELGVRVHLENLSEVWSDLEPTLTAIQELALTLDLGHAQLLQPDNAAFGILDHLFDRVRHLHLHDNHGGNSPRDDLHLIPGQGIVPFKEIFARLKQGGYSGPATLELRPHELERGRAWVREVWASA